MLHILKEVTFRVPARGKRAARRRTALDTRITTMPARLAARTSRDRVPSAPPPPSSNCPCSHMPLCKTTCPRQGTYSSSSDECLDFLWCFFFFLCSFLGFTSSSGSSSSSSSTWACAAASSCSSSSSCASPAALSP